MWYILLIYCLFWCHITSFKINNNNQNLKPNLNNINIKPSNNIKIEEILKRSAMILTTSFFISFHNIAPVNAVSSSFSLSSSYSNSMTLAETLTEVEQEVEEVADSVLSEVFKDSSNQSKQSPGWELARQKRTAAIKAMERNKMIKVETDELGNQYLALPWLPNQKIKYKSLALSDRLKNECFAGAFGEISKDGLLYWVDTAKTRAQIQKKSSENDDSDSDSGMNEIPTTSSSSGSSSSSGDIDMMLSSEAVTIKDNMNMNMNMSPLALLSTLKGLYAGFPVVAASSIPQGAIFFLVKGGILEIFKDTGVDIPIWVNSIVPIIISTMVYWIIRTPQEVIKTNIQAGKEDNVKDAIKNITERDGIKSLWRFYNVMVSLDVPFQVINFILYGFLSDAVINSGIETNIWTRLAVGIGCGMAAAAVTCPIDVCKTRIQTSLKGANNEIDVTTTGNQMLSDIDSIAIMSNNNDDISFLNNNVDDENRNIGIVKERQITTNTDTINTNNDDNNTNNNTEINQNVLIEMKNIVQKEGVSTLFLGLGQRVLYTGLANGIRFAAYGTSRMDLMMRSLDDL